MSRFQAYSIMAGLCLTVTVAARAADYHCSEEQGVGDSSGNRQLFIWVDRKLDECTVGAQGQGVLPERIIGQVECSQGEVQLQLGENNARRAPDGKIEYRSRVRLRWDDQGSRPVFKNYVFYCRPAE